MGTARSQENWKSAAVFQQTAVLRQQERMEPFCPRTAHGFELKDHPEGEKEGPRPPSPVCVQSVL